MTPAHIKAIRKQAGLSQTGLAAVLRIADQRTIRRWETGKIPISGPASVILELLDAGELPKRFVTVQSITQELEEARALALATETPSAAVAASMGKAKLHGLILDKAVVDSRQEITLVERRVI